MAEEDEGIVGEVGHDESVIQKQPEGMDNVDWQELETIMLYLDDEELLMTKREKTRKWYTSRSLSNKLYLEQKLYSLEMLKGKNLNQCVQSYRF